MLHFKNKIAVAAAALLVMGAAGCTDLGVEPKSTVTGANVWDEPASYRAFIAKLYAGLAVSGQQGPAGRPDISGIDEGFSQYLRLIWQMQELPTDEAVIAWNDAGVQELNTQLWSSSNQFLQSMYYRVYFQVGLANEFLRETTDEKLTSRNVSPTLRAEIQQYRAEARYLRALSYWHGIDLFGDIPLVREDVPLNGPPPAQATRAEVYAYVVSELNELRTGLPAIGEAQYGRVDQGAVYMLLAKLYLNAQVYAGQNRFAEARAATEAIISSGAYQLDSNWRRMFRADNHTSPELIFAVPQDGARTQSFGGTTFLTHAAAGGDMNISALGLDFGWWGLRVRPDVVNLFPGGAASADVRASVFFTAGQSLSIGNLTDFKQGYASLKYQNVTSTGLPGSAAAYSDVDYPMFRLSDVYLMYAEAVLRGGGGSTTQAAAYVNALRTRAYGNTSSNFAPSELTLSLILDERARELMWEGHRRTDLVRYGQFTTGRVWNFKGGVQAGKVTETFRNLYPLPASELIANPNLEQNTGY